MKLQQKKAKKFREALMEYERFKKDFIMEHPEATSKEYEEAIRKKADELDL